MNAGAFGYEIWGLVTGVETINRRGDIQSRPASAFQAAYRQVAGLDQEWFVAGVLRLTTDPAAADTTNVSPACTRPTSVTPK